MDKTSTHGKQKGEKVVKMHFLIVTDGGSYRALCSSHGKNATSSWRSVTCKRCRKMRPASDGDLLTCKPPKGYIEYVPWAEAMMKKGHRQVRCETCGKFYFPCEHHRHGRKR